MPWCYNAEMGNANSLLHASAEYGDHYEKFGFEGQSSAESLNETVVTQFIFC